MVVPVKVPPLLEHTTISTVLLTFQVNVEDPPETIDVGTASRVTVIGKRARTGLFIKPKKPKTVITKANIISNFLYMRICFFHANWLVILIHSTL